MGTPTTFIKLDRSITSWRWFNDAVTLQLWIYILIHANITERDFMDVTIHRGELATSYPSLAKELGRSVKQIRTALNHLKKTGEVAVRVYPKFSVISVLNYNTYQAQRQAEGSQTAVNGQSTGNNIRIKEVKNERSVCEKHAHGIFNNIYLTDDEYRDYRLRVREIDAVIDELSESVAANPSKYRQGEITAWLNKFIRQKYGRLPERRKLLNDLH